MIDNNLGKKAEKKIKEWLDRPQDGYCLDRLKDQMTGFYGSTNICDFTLFKSPNMYYIESKATWDDRFDFSVIAGFDESSNVDRQYGGLLHKSTIANVYGLVIVLFATHKRAFILDIREINRLMNDGIKSININKIDKWSIQYSEIQTVPNNRKHLLDYQGDWVYPVTD